MFSQNLLKSNMSDDFVKNYNDKPKKLALAHDFLLGWGGAERTFKVLADAYPDAPIYTLLADPAFVKKYFPGRDVRTSFLQKLPFWLRRRYQLLLPFYPVAVETIDLRDFDVVLSSSGAWMKGLVTRLHTYHIAYLHSPMRYVWDSQEKYLADLGKSKHLLLRLILSYLRIWDRQSAERPDLLLVNSQYTAQRVKKYYRRETEIVFPPATLLSETASLVETPQKPQNYFLIVARLTRAKRVETIIEAFERLNLPLIVVGSGPERARLEKKGSANIQFVGSVSDEKLISLYRSARALLQPSEEDFGMAAMEAFSFGVPVIALAFGAARTLIIPGKTGELYSSDTPEMAADGVRRFLVQEKNYDRSMMKILAAEYSPSHFLSGIREAINHTISFPL